MAIMLTFVSGPNTTLQVRLPNANTQLKYNEPIKNLNLFLKILYNRQIIPFIS